YFFTHGPELAGGFEGNGSTETIAPQHVGTLRSCGANSLCSAAGQLLDCGSALPLLRQNTHDKERPVHSEMLCQWAKTVWTLNDWRDAEQRRQPAFRLQRQHGVPFRKCVVGRTLAAIQNCRDARDGRCSKKCRKCKLPAELCLNEHDKLSGSQTVTTQLEEIGGGVRHRDAERLLPQGGQPFLGCGGRPFEFLIGTKHLRFERGKRLTIDFAS